MRADPHQNLSENVRGRDFYVGDIHGMYERLCLSLDKLQFDPAIDRLISVGDLCDRGPQSIEVLQLFHSSPWFHAVLGNHEAMIHRLHTGDPVDWWNHDLWFRRLTTDDREWIYDAICSMPLTMQVHGSPTVGVVHADVSTTWPEIRRLSWSDINIYDEWASKPGAACLWGRSRAAAFKAGKPITAVEGVDLLVCGHSVLPEPSRAQNVVFLDTGACTAEGLLSFYSGQRGLVSV